MGKRDGKSEKPTEKKKKDARKKGDVSKSQDLGPWITLLVATYVIPYTIGAVGRAGTESLAAIRQMARQPDALVAVRLLGQDLRAGLLATLPILVVCMVIGIVSHVAQTGLVLSLHPLKPDFKKVNPIEGTKRMFSPRSLWETAKQVAKSAAITWMCYPHVIAISDQLTSYGRVPLLEGLSSSGRALTAMTRSTCYAVIAISLADYAFQKRMKVLDLRMTVQEVRDEYKNAEGDPHIKQRIRAIQTSLARNRMMADIPTASVVITNPTHVAIALLYDPLNGGAPKVVAAGIGSLAAKIRERALASGVPIVEAKPLARALWRSCEVGDEIPVVLYEAVAKVLAFVRRLRGSILSASALPLPRQFHVDQITLEAVQGQRRKRQLV